RPQPLYARPPLGDRAQGVHPRAQTLGIRRMGGSGQRWAVDADWARLSARRETGAGNFRRGIARLISLGYARGPQEQRKSPHPDQSREGHCFPWSASGLLPTRSPADFAKPAIATGESPWLVSLRRNLLSRRGTLANPWPARGDTGPSRRAYKDHICTRKA